jgi:hypothetical protein
MLKVDIQIRKIGFILYGYLLAILLMMGNSSLQATDSQFNLFRENIEMADSIGSVSDFNQKKVNRHELGFSAGTSSGYGYAYRLWHGKLGGQIVFMQYHRSYIERYVLGLTFMHTLIRNEISNLFIYLSNGYIARNRYYKAGLNYSSRLESSYFLNEAQTNRKRILSHGIGIGYEVYSMPGKLNPFGLSFMSGLATYHNFTRANLTAEISVMFKFRR